MHLYIRKVFDGLFNKVYPFGSRKKTRFGRIIKDSNNQPVTKARSASGDAEMAQGYRVKPARVNGYQNCCPFYI